MSVSTEFDPAAMFSLQGKRAVVIGGSGVLGGVFCRALAAAGAKVAPVGRTPGKAEAFAQKLEADGYEALGLTADATRKDSLQDACRQAAERWGGVDILTNAPGVNSATPFFDISEEEWDRILSANLKSMFFACQVFGAQMIEQGQGGCIINISSVSSGPPLSRVFTYSASKAAVNNLTQWLAREFAPSGIRVNAVIPGFFPAEQNRKILTEDPERISAILKHTPMGRLGEPEELAGTVVWLASEKAAGFVTGALIRVDGGFSAMTI